MKTVPTVFMDVGRGAGVVAAGEPLPDEDSPRLHRIHQTSRRGRPSQLPALPRAGGGSLPWRQDHGKYRETSAYVSVRRRLQRWGGAQLTADEHPRRHASAVCLCSPRAEVEGRNRIAPFLNAERAATEAWASVTAIGQLGYRKGARSLRCGAAMP